MKRILAVIGGILVVIGSAFAGTQLGSVQRSGEYQPKALISTTATTLLQTGASTLGSVVITGANTGVVEFLDATTTNVGLRVGTTSTLRKVSIPASTAAGTYTFDIVFVNGLLMDILGLAPTSTVTWR